MAAEGNSFPKMMGPDTYTFFPLVVLTFFALSRNENALMSTFPNPLQKGVTFLTAGSVTRSSNLFTMSEIPWCYLKRISFQSQIPLLIQPKAYRCQLLGQAIVTRHSHTLFQPFLSHNHTSSVKSFHLCQLYHLYSPRFFSLSNCNVSLYPREIQIHLFLFARFLQGFFF